LGEQAALGQQLWRTALGHNFGEQRRGTALGSSFGEQLWTAFRTSFEAASGNSIGILGSGSNFEEQFWGAIVGSNFSVLKATLTNNCFGNDSFGE
jgi:hypothetical protein